MKKLILFMTAATIAANPVFAQSANPQSASLCRGDFSDSIVDSVEKCSDAELNRSYAEIAELEKNVAKDLARLEEVKKESGERKVSYNQVVFVETHYTTAMWLSIAAGAITTPIYAMAGLTHGKEATAKKFGRLAAGSAIAAIMSIALGVAAKIEKPRLELEFKDIPELEKSIKRMQAEIELRKKAIEVAIKLKQLK